MATPFEIKTARLLLKPFTVQDVDALHRLWTDPGVRKYLWDGIVISRDRTEEEVRKSIQAFAEHGFGFWTISVRSTQEMAGFCGFRFVENSNEVEILYGLLPAYWGRGMASEAARRLMQWGFIQRGFSHILGRTDAPNAASVRLLEKIGMTFKGREYVNNLDTLKYEITRQHFLESYSGNPSGVTELLASTFQEVPEELSAIANHLIDCARTGQTESFPRFFEITEYFIIFCTEEVRNLLIVRLLEELKNLTSLQNFDYAFFESWLGPETHVAWRWLEKRWRGHSLGDAAKKKASEI